jgi:hypothetical protein
LINCIYKWLFEVDKMPVKSEFLINCVWSLLAP